MSLRNETSYIVDYSNSEETKLKVNHQQYCLLLKPSDKNYNINESKESFGFSPEELYIFVEAFHPKYQEVYEFLIQIAEPVNKPNFIHLYKITLFSMYTAMSLNLDSNSIIEKLMEYSKNVCLPKSFKEFIEKSTQRAGSAYLYMKEKNYYLKIDQEFTEFILNKSDGIIQLEDNPPKKLSEILNEPGSNRIFKLYRVLDKNRLFVITESIIKESIFLINEYYDDTIPSDTDLDTQDIYQNKKLDMKLKQITQPRIYQYKALRRIFVCEKPRSSTIVLPCGAGKTLLGILITEKIKGNTIIICDVDTATKQWKNEFLKWTTVKLNRIKILTGKTKTLKNPDHRAFILITTFKQLSSIIDKNEKSSVGLNSKIDQTKYSLSVGQIIQEMEWDLCIADETQCSAAKTYKPIFQKFYFKLKIGLTATPYREDNKIDDLYHIIGPKLYEANISELIQDNHLAKPYCVVFRCKMPDEIQKTLQDKSEDQKQQYYSGNPNKFKLLHYLIKLHEQRKDKILVYCDQISALKYYSEKMGYPAIYGEVQLIEKLAWLDLFRKGQINTLFLSRVGDTALDLPIANVCIQIGFCHGSRRQEIQRLGRIMRRKEGQKGEFNAFFYTILSKNTSQSFSYSKRQKALMDLGLNFEVVDVDTDTDVDADVDAEVDDDDDDDFYDNFQNNNFYYDNDILDQNILSVQTEIERFIKFLDENKADKCHIDDD